jgi:putative hydrolase of the HAD superfamily
VDACAIEIYEEWAANHHFEMYDDVPDVLRTLAGRGLRIGLISNSHRCLVSFQSHFELQGLITAAISSSQHGYLKPHRSIFDAALKLLGVPAADAVMVGDSVGQDIEGARRAGMRAVLVRRGASDQPFGGEVEGDVPIIRTLRELPPLLLG